MNKDRAEGKVKDIAGRVERQAGERTGDAETQARGAVKEVEGKAQNAWGKAKDAVKDATKKDDEAQARRNEERPRLTRKKLRACAAKPASSFLYVEQKAGEGFRFLHPFSFRDEGSGTWGSTFFEKPVYRDVAGSFHSTARARAASDRARFSPPAWLDAAKLRATIGA